ncbi:MAG TPA: LuxR C-terminal-related transcriptional regulator [Anaeromyxobacter sp.]|nr:LuxR C-terminal-related transcriptional regulator [Anaeromyxobacter sp.]
MRRRSTLANQGVPTPGDEVAVAGGTSPPPHLDAISDEALIELARIAPAALLVALEAIPSPAFVLRLPAVVLHANRRGRALLDLERERALTLLRGTEPPPRGPVRLPIDSASDHALVVLRDLEGDAASRLETVARRWGLTPRQSAVLELVAQGETNRTVGTRLGCSEKTVELHVSALLAKTRCTSRSQLVASFWTDLG